MVTISEHHVFLVGTHPHLAGIVNKVQIESVLLD